MAKEANIEDTCKGDYFNSTDVKMKWWQEAYSVMSVDAGRKYQHTALTKWSKKE